MHNFEGIIFDIDGTLTSTNRLIFASFNHITEMFLNKTMTDEEIIALFGPTEDVILKNWFPDNYYEVQEEYYKFYKENHHMAALYPGIKDVLNFLKEKKIPLSIFTGKGKQAAEITLKELGIYSYFDFFATGDDVKEHKPSPEGILNFIEKFNLTPKRVLMIGDSVADIHASKEAGVKIASAVWDSYAKEKVLKLESDFVFHSVNELNIFLRENI